MNARLRDIVRKLAEAKQTASLTDEDFAYLAGLVAAERGSAAPDQPRPLWSYISRRALVYGRVFDLPRWDFGANKLLGEAGMPTTNLSYEDSNQRWVLPVHPQALRRAVTWGLQQDDGDVRYHAAVLIGYVGYDDLLPMLVDDLESGRGERSSYGGARIAGALQALAMLQHPRAATLALSHASSDDYSIRNTARIACLLCQDQLAPAELDRALEASFEVYDFVKLPHAFVRAAVRGALAQERLRKVVDDLYLSVDVCQWVAEVLVSAGWHDLFKEYIEHSDADLRTALALRVAWSEHTWARDALRARLDEEDSESAQMAILAALGSFDSDADDLLAAKLDDGSEWERTGAMWGSLGRAKFEAKVRDQLNINDSLVRGAAWCALASLDTAHPEASELAFSALLNRDDWWPWAVGLRALEGRGVDLPVPLRGFVYASEHPQSLSEVDAAVEFYRRHPKELLRWLGREPGPDQRARTLQYAGLVGGETMRSIVEHNLLGMGTVDESVKAARELVGLGGAENPVARVKLGLCTTLNTPLEQEDLVPCALLAQAGTHDIHVRATTSLARFGRAAEPYIRTLLFHPDDDISQAAAEAVSRLQDPEDPLLRDTAALLNGSVRRIAELESLDRLFNAPAKRVREALADAAGRAENEPDEVLHYLLRLAVDKDAAVAGTAAASLATKFPQVPWIKELILRNSKSDDWQLARSTVATMAQVADPVFVPRLIELAADENHGHQDAAVKGLERVSEQYPALGLIVLDIRDPYRVDNRYALGGQIDYQADRHTESLRLLMLALDKTRSAERAKAEAGRKVMLTPLTAESRLGPSETGWDERTFEQLALYLQVTFMDEESGAIIAEISPEPTGEVLSALLQTRAVCATTIAWS